MHIYIPLFLCFLYHIRVLLFIYTRGQPSVQYTGATIIKKKKLTEILDVTGQQYCVVLIGLDGRCRVTGTTDTGTKQQQQQQTHRLEEQRRTGCNSVVHDV